MILELYDPRPRLACRQASRISPLTPSPDYLAESPTPDLGRRVRPDTSALRKLAAELGLNVWAVEDAIPGIIGRVKATVYRRHRMLAAVYAVGSSHPGPGRQASSCSDQGADPRRFVTVRALVTVRLAPGSVSRCPAGGQAGLPCRLVRPARRGR